MKYPILIFALLAVGVAFFSTSTKAHAALTPSIHPAIAEIDPGEIYLYQNGKSLSATSGNVSGNDWHLCGFVLVEEIQGQVHELWILATSPDPTGAKRWAPYTWPGGSSTHAKDIATRFVHYPGSDEADDNGTWSDMLANVGLEESDVNTATFIAMASDPTVGTLP